MPEFPLSQSPRTQAFQMPQAPEDEKDLFTQGFSELAYRALQKSQPEMVNNVITFRVLDVDVDEGRGIGTFILHNEQDIVFVPCVVSDNAVKPLDLFYSRTADRFYPLTSAWMRESSKMNVNQLGGGVKAPKTMPTDVDIRNLVVPPTTGRYSYASTVEDDAWLPFVVALRKEKLAEQRESPKFLGLIAQTSDGFKLAFAQVLHRRPKLAKLFAEFYGAEKVAAVLSSRREKVAQEHRKEVNMKASVAVMTNATPVEQIKRELKPGEAARAFQQIRLHGFYVKDSRPSTDDVFSFAETDLRLTQPEAPGVYKVYTAKGEAETCIIVPRPVSIHRKRSDEARMPMSYYRDNRNTERGLGLRREYLVLFKDGRYAMMDDMIAEPIIEVSHGEVEAFLNSITKAIPGNGEYGVLISAADLTIRAIEPLFVDSVTSAGDRITFRAANHHTVVMSKSFRGNSVVRSQDSDTVMLGASYRWFKCGQQLANSDILNSPAAIMGVLERSLEKKGAQKILVKKAGRDFIVAGDGKPVTSFKAVEKLANVYNVRVKEASELITLAGAGLPIRAFRVKAAQGESLDPNAPPQPPMPEQDPNAPPGPPPPPSGLDLATNEKLQQIQAQIAALQQMQQILTEVQQRAQMIDQGGGQMAAPAAAAGMMAGPGSMGGQPPMAPAPMGGQPGMDPSQMGGQPGMDPSQMGGQPGMDPSQMGAAVPPGGGLVPPGAPPGPQPPPPPPPIMPEGPVSPQNLEQQMNPQFLQEAAGLQDQGIFDATAIASMAKQRGLREMLQNYTPSIEKAMDNLGRMLLLLYMKEGDIKGQIGAEAYEETEQKVRDVFRGLGDAILSVNQYSNQLDSNNARQV
jgi:hypothetical protein